MNLFGGGHFIHNIIPMLQRQLDVVKILPEKIVCDGRAIEIPHGWPSKGNYILLELKANCF